MTPTPRSLLSQLRDVAASKVLQLEEATQLKVRPLLEEAAQLHVDGLAMALNPADPGARERRRLECEAVWANVGSFTDMAFLRTAQEAFRETTAQALRWALGAGLALL